MIIVRDRKIYNTEKAKIIHTWSGSWTWGRRALVPFNCWTHITLYKTDKGSYFKYSELSKGSVFSYFFGLNSILGPLKYSVRHLLGREKKDVYIEPLTESEAINWLEELNGSAALEKYFADKIEEV